MEKLNFANWVSIITDCIMALTAVVMAFLAYRTYLKTPEQESEPKKGKADADTESELKQLTVFKTSKQETILRITPQGLECHLNDTRPNKGGHQWTLSKASVQHILATSNFFVNPGYKPRSGTFSIGQRRNWLYSKKLFPEPQYLRSAIKDLLKNTVE